MSSAKPTSDNIFWLLLIWPRSKWMTPKVGRAKEKAHHILYWILLAIHISTCINFSSAPTRWMTRFHHAGCHHLHWPFCARLPQHFKTLLPWLMKTSLPELRGHHPDHRLGKAVPGQTRESNSYSLPCSLLKEYCYAEVKFTSGLNK